MMLRFRITPTLMMKTIAQHVLRGITLFLTALQLFFKLPERASVKCQLSDYVFLRRVPRRTIITKTSNLH